MSKFLSEIQEKYTEIGPNSEIFNRLVFPKKCMKFNRFSHPMTHFPPKRKAFPLSLLVERDIN